MEGWRFVLPAIPGLAIGLAAGAAVLARERVWAQAAVAGIVAAVGIASVGMEQARNLDVVMRTDEHRAPQSFAESWEGSMSYALAGLAEVVPPGASVAYTEIGIVGYATDWEVIDLAGLTSREVAGATGMDLDEVVAWLGQQQPDVIVLKERGWELLGAIRGADWLAENYTEVDAELAGIRVYRRHDVPAPSWDEQLETLATAVERAPRFKLLHQRRVRIALKHGSPEQLQDACDELGAALPSLELDSCRAASRPVARVARTVPIMPAANAAEPAAIEWVVSGEGAATIAVDSVSLAAAGGPYRVCEAGRWAIAGPVRVVGQVRSEAVGRERMGAQVQLRWFDDKGVFIDGTMDVAHQAVGTEEWTRIDATFAPPEGARKVRLCLEFGAETGRMETRGVRRI
jgi:hypothetical protein